MTLSNPRDPNNWDEAYNKKSPLWDYIGNSAVWHCPKDPSTATPQGQRVLRIRSYRLNNWVGGPGWGSSGPWWPQNSTGWKVYLNISHLTDPGPNRTFAFLDEREDSIDDGYWPVEMNGYPDQPALARIVDYPADWHNRGANLSFADGHTESWRWRDLRTMPRHQSKDLPLDQPSANNPDILRLQEASTRKVL